MRRSWLAEGASFHRGILAGASPALIAFVVCVVVVPKAGIKVLDTYPVTTSVVATAFAAIGSLRIATSDALLSRLGPYRARLGVLVFVVGAVSLVSVLEWGLRATLETAVPMLLPVFTLPWLVARLRHCERPVGLVVGAGLVAVAYGGLQILFGRDRTVVPGITVNYSDWAELGSFVFVSKNNSTEVGLKLTSTYQNGNLYAVLLVVLLSLLLAHVLVARPRTIDVVVTALVGASAVLTLSRSCLIASAAVVGFLAVKRGAAGIVRVGAAAVVAIGMLLTTPFADRLFEFDLTGAGRVALYGRYLEAVWALDVVGFLRYLTIGFGPGVNGAFGDVSGPLGSPSAIPLVENAPANLLLIGGVVLVVAYVRPFVRGWRAMNAAGVVPATRLGLHGAMLGLAVMSMLDRGLVLPPTGALMWLVLALAFDAANRAASERGLVATDDRRVPA